MKAVRRSIIVICLFLLLPLLSSIFNSIPKGKYYNHDLKNKVKSGDAQVIEVNKKWKIDKDTIIIQRIINTDKNTYVRVSCIMNPNGWSFPLSEIELYDDKGKKFIASSEEQGKLWGEDGLNVYERFNPDCKELTLKLQWYDKKMELKIPCPRSGNI